MKKPAETSRAIYCLLALYIVASMTYYVANMAGFIDNYFDLHHRAATPFQFDIDTLQITAVRPKAQKAGLAKGDVLREIDGAPYAGEAGWLTLIRSEHPGDDLRVTVRQPDGTDKRVSFQLIGRGSSEQPHFSEWAGLLALYGLPSLICLLIGYWVVAARPRDFNAWLILFILTFTETLFNLSLHWWPGYGDFWSMEWVQAQQLLSPAALLLFGIYFPERWSLDRKLPWLKYALIVPILLAVVLSTWIVIREEFHAGLSPAIVVANLWMERIVFCFAAACIALYCSAIPMKSGSASTPDARRRLQVLALGSEVGLGSLLLFFVILPLVHVNVQDPWIAGTGTILFLVFPFTLAYVVVVQRAMDVRILVRMGTKYALARATISVVRVAVIAGLTILLVEFVRTPKLTPFIAIGILVLAALLLLLRSRVMRNFSANLDRRFFREAYNAEQLLSELSERVRKYSQTGPLIDMVSKTISQTLHIEKIGVLLRGGNSFVLQQAVGLPINGTIQLPAHSSTVRNLARINTPVTLYRENPDGWLLLASASERSLLDDMSTELLLPLPGREQLMGMMTLGPKRSEEPYSPTDLRLLQTVATQTGLAIEISNLAQSLASEASHRERIQREIEIAREVQERLFPQELPELDGVSLAGACRPAQGVGGDYYDLFALEDGRLGIAVGDVSGKGISAALLMASLRASLRGMMLDGPRDLAAMMQKVNRLVYEASATNRYATFFFAAYNPVTRELSYVNAGHNAPFLLRRNGNGIESQRLEAGGPVVGLLPLAPYDEQTLVLEPGDLLLSYTDGISEAMTEADEEWGEERMAAAAQSLPDGTAQQVLEHLFAEADRFTGKAPQYDDMTLLVLKLERA